MAKCLQSKERHHVRGSYYDDHFKPFKPHCRFNDRVYFPSRVEPGLCTRPAAAYGTARGTAGANRTIKRRMAKSW